MVIKKRQFIKNQKAVALVLAMFILVFLSIIGVAFLNLVASDLLITTNHLGRQRALYIAEAGVEYAISQLRITKNWTVNSQETIFPSATSSSYTISYPKSGTSRTIISSAQVDNNKFTAGIEARVSIQGSSSPYVVKIVNFQETG
jgi:Tfp pilus assembly protein PilX